MNWLKRMPAWIAIAATAIALMAAIVGGIMHVGAVEQRVVDQGKRIDQNHELLSDLVNGLLTNKDEGECR